MKSPDFAIRNGSREAHGQSGPTRLALLALAQHELESIYIIVYIGQSNLPFVWARTGGGACSQVSVCNVASCDQMLVSLCMHLFMYNSCCR